MGRRFRCALVREKKPMIEISKYSSVIALSSHDEELLPALASEEQTEPKHMLSEEEQFVIRKIA